MIFNFTTKREGCDEACEIQPQEHPAVHDPTVIAYRRGSLLAPVALQTMRRLGMYSRGERASPDLLRRIQEGDIASEFTPIKLQRFVEEAMESST
ncbi:MAG: hypothetical protein O7H41_08355 [Planctomycetota bacterium]|nr:hypothetical protein [Planctomycetota bacterium]